MQQKIVFERRGVMTDETGIDDIEEIEIDENLKEELRSIPEMEIVKKAIAKKTWHEKQHLEGLTSDMLKVLPKKALERLTLIIQKFWKGEEKKIGP
jgi:hypothetical protein